MTRLEPRAIVEGVRELPSLPAVVMDLIVAMGNDGVSADQLATRIARDPSLSAKMLRLANSPFYGMPGRVSTVSDATKVMGLRMLRSVALAASVIDSFPAAACRILDFQAYWRHCVGTALCAQSLAQAARVDASIAFTLGLLHDIGRLLLASRFSQEYADVLRCQQEYGIVAHEAENEVLGTNHAVIGGCIAEHWRFAPEFCKAIVEHHAPPDDPSGTAGLLDLTHVADNMAHALDLSKQDDDVVPPLSIQAWIRLRLDEGHCVKVFREVETQHQAICDALSI